jgi:hypothetical protein
MASRGDRFLALSWFLLQLWIHLPRSNSLQLDDLICVFPQQSEPDEILRLLTHIPHIKLNIFYWHLADLGFNAASLSLPPHIALDLSNDHGVLCEPVRNMRIASREYADSLRRKYLKKKHELEKSIQCTITYDIYEQLLEHNSDSEARNQNNIVCPPLPLPSSSDRNRVSMCWTPGFKRIIRNLSSQWSMPSMRSRPHHSVTIHTGTGLRWQVRLSTSDPFDILHLRAHRWENRWYLSSLATCGCQSCRC